MNISKDERINCMKFIMLIVLSSSLSLHAMQRMPKDSVEVTLIMASRITNTPYSPEITGTVSRIIDEKTETYLVDVSPEVEIIAIYCLEGPQKGEKTCTKYISKCPFEMDDSNFDKVKSLWEQQQKANDKK